jgi:hypothetical protein
MLNVVMLSVVILSVVSRPEHFIFFLIYKWTQKARLVSYIKLKRLAKHKHSGLMGPFVSYEDKEMSGMRSKIFTEEFMSNTLGQNKVVYCMLVIPRFKLG